MATEIPGAHFVGEVGQKAIIEHEGKVLFVRYPDSGHPNADLWDLPGGRLHKNEAPRDGLLREVKEELGLDVEMHEPIFVFAQHELKPTWPRYFVIFRASLVDPAQPMVLAPDEIGEAQWVSKDELEHLKFWPGWKDHVREFFNKRTNS